MPCALFHVSQTIHLEGASQSSLMNRITRGDLKEIPRPNLSHPDSIKTGVGLIKKYVGILFNRFRNHEIQPILCPCLNKTHKSLPPHKIPAGRGLPFLQVPVVFDV